MLVFLLSLLLLLLLVLIIPSPISRDSFLASAGTSARNVPYKPGQEVGDSFMQDIIFACGVALQILALACWAGGIAFLSFIAAPVAFKKSEPTGRQTWRIYLDRNGARAVCEAPSLSLAFAQDAFDNDPRMAAFAWDR